MPTYREFREQTKRRRRKRAFCRFIVLILIVLLAAAAVFAAARFLKDHKEPKTEFSASQSVQQPESSISPSPQPTPAPTAVPETVPEQAAQPGAWDTMQPQQKTLDQTVNMPEYRMLGLPENGQVDMKYFDRTAILGDSVSQGWNVFETSDMKEHAFICAYKNIGPSQVVNNQMANPGQASGRGEEAIFDTIINSKPKRLYILLGTNALVRNDDMAEQSYLAYYSQMLDKFREALGGEVAIYVQSVTPVRPGVSQPGLFKERIHRVNNALAKMAVEKGCYFINLHEVLADENGDLREDLAAADGVHLNASAYPLLRDYLTTHTAYHPENPYLEGSPYYKAPEVPAE